MYRAKTVERLLRQAERREQDLRRENQQLLDRLMYALDRTWSPPPNYLSEEPEEATLYPFELPDEMPIE